MIILYDLSVFTKLLLCTLASVYCCMLDLSFSIHLLMRDTRSIFIAFSSCGFQIQGFVHMALQSRLPIVPIVLSSTHRAWRKGSLHIRPAPITVKYLPPISTSDWTADKLDDYIKMVHDIYVKNLPEPQKPFVSDSTRTCSNS